MSRIDRDEVIFRLEAIQLVCMQNRIAEWEDEIEEGICTPPDMEMKEIYERILHKSLIDRYPFLTVEGYDDTTPFEKLPMGWKVSFGILMMEKFLGLWEKFPSSFTLDDMTYDKGVLHFKVSYSEDNPRLKRKLNKLMKKFSKRSAETCMHCGRKHSIPEEDRGHELFLANLCDECAERGTL